MGKTKKKIKSKEHQNPKVRVGKVAGVPSRWKAYCILVLAVFFAFWPCLRNDFVYDDHVQLVENPYLRDFKNIKILFTKDIWYWAQNRTQEQAPSNNFRPMHALAHLVTFRLFGMSAFAFHAVNLGLYVLCTLLLFKLAKYYLDSNFAFLGCLIFAVHPAHVESVAYIAGIPDLLCGIFVLLSLWLYLRRKFLLLLPVFGCALLSKEPALMFPAVLIADNFLFKRFPWKQRIPLGAGLVITICAYWLLRNHALGMFIRSNQVQLNVFGQIVSGLAYSGLYFWKAAFPYPLNALYDYHLPPSGLLLLAGVSGVLSVFGLAIWQRKNPVFLFLLSLFGMFLFPALVVTAVSKGLFAERYLFIPSMGLILALVLLARGAMARKILFAVVLLFAVISAERCTVWKSDYSLWADTIVKSPQSETVNFNLATAYVQQKNWSLAMEYYKKTIALEPGKAEAYYNLAGCQQKLGDYRAAEESLKKVLQYWKGPQYFRDRVLQDLQRVQGLENRK